MDRDVANKIEKKLGDLDKSLKNLVKEVEQAYNKTIRDKKIYEYFENGALKRVANYNGCGRLDGDYITFNEDGLQMLRGKYWHGKRVGTWYIADPSTPSELKEIRYYYYDDDEKKANKNNNAVNELYLTDRECGDVFLKASYLNSEYIRYYWSDRKPLSEGEFPF